MLRRRWWTKLDNLAHTPGGERFAAVDKRFVALDPGAGFCQLLRRHAQADEAGDNDVVDLAHGLDDLVTRERSAGYQMPVVPV
jgi:hypothetical protein